MMLDHVSIGVANLEKARAFYDAVLSPLGYSCVYTVDIPGQGIVAHGYGATREKPEFWIGVRHDIDAFHAAALKHGGKDNGAPGLRPHYHENYYGAFAFDPDGNKIEACSHHPE
jgi:catechol 2,3-dioxygenase-like lactoylglutathione lyase family enzyme